MVGGGKAVGVGAGGGRRGAFIRGVWVDE